RRRTRDRGPTGGRAAAGSLPREGPDHQAAQAGRGGTMSEALDHLANRVAADPFFLAFPLAEYARSERLDDSALAAALGCRVEDLTLLRLCRMPRDDPAGFRADTAAIAERFGIAPAKLADAVRRGQGLARLPA